MSSSISGQRMPKPGPISSQRLRCSFGGEQDSKRADDIQAQAFGQMPGRLLVHDQVVGVKLEGQADGFALAGTEACLENRGEMG